ncbi:MAG: dNTP triphosphohydrolase [Aeromonadales bacterium]|nr:dNTP triphosphohydrolase [Aeromonadales bacterium]
MDLNEISKRLFCAKRLRGVVLSKAQTLDFLQDPDFYNYGVEQDRLLISMSAPMRRLQQKTQVFPLDVKAASRNRLTHSLEVQEYSRLIAFAMVKYANKTDLKPILPAMVSCLSNAALMHDIGNPPFGHFGESLIRDWLKKTVENRYISSEISLVEKDDLLTFNGNAQGLRLTNTIQGLNLTLGQYASVIKVPYTVKELLLGQGKGTSGNGIQGDFFSWSYANAGVFLSEKYLLDAIRENCNRDTRHPFATIIEYADDLAYVLADLEDSYDRGLVDKYTILKLCNNINEFSELDELKEYLSVDKIEKLFNEDKTQALFYLRDVISYFYIRDLALAINSDFETFVFTGEPDFSMGNYPGITTLKMLKDFENQHIYNHFEVQTLDLSGASYIQGLLGQYQKLLFESRENFEKELYAKGGKPFNMRIASRISRRHKKTYQEFMQSEQFSPIYLRIRLIVDYISGMTDTFAKSEYKVLNGIH